MKKMLVIGDGDSVFIKDFVNQYDKKGVSVDLISFGQEIKNKLIDKVAELNIEVLDNIHLVFPLAYGGNSKELIKVALDQNKNIKYTILDQFYDFHEIAKLRSVIDILINIQPTDQFSGSMQETLYAGGWVLAGSWLPYQQLTELTSKLILIDSVDDVAEKLNAMVVNGCKKSEDNNELVRNFIKKSSSWEENIPIWDDILFPSEVG